MLNSETRARHKLTLTGITASAPYVRENGFSPVDLRGFVRYAHKTLGSSSAQLPFAPFSLLFKPFTITLFTTSTWPLPWGYAGEEYLFLMPRLLQNSRKAQLSNCSPLSDIKESGTPNLVIIFFHTNFFTSMSRILAKASASAHLVK